MTIIKKLNKDLKNKVGKTINIDGFSYYIEEVDVWCLLNGKLDDVWRSLTNDKNTPNINYFGNRIDIYNNGVRCLVIIKK